MGALAGAGWAAYLHVGRTPGELIDYAKKRLEGHDKLQWLALPFLDAAVGFLGEPNALDRALPFTVPPPTAPRERWSASQGPSSSGDPLRVLVGPGRAITSLALASQLAPDGAVVEVDPADYVGDVAVWLQKKLTIRGTAPGVRLFAAGRSAEGKAIWVIRNGNFLVENIEFIGARVTDRNGAGIRFEGGDLLVRKSRFYGNENGILGGDGEKSSLAIEDCEFAFNGSGDGLSHGIYVGVGHLRLTGNYFHHSNVGHLVKSRSRYNRIEYNRFSDEAGGRASYELEFPDGGIAELVGNFIQQGPGTLNSVIVSMGAESYAWPENRLVMAHNTVVNDRRFGGTFVRVVPGAEPSLLLNNLWVGPGRVSKGGPAISTGNQRVDWASFVQPARLDYRLNDGARASVEPHRLAAVPQKFQPVREYLHPAQTQVLKDPPRYPGAFQSGAPLK